MQPLEPDPNIGISELDGTSAHLAANGYDDTRDERLTATRARLATTVARDETAVARMHQATRRDEIAHLRDITAQRRDLAADARDRAAVRRAARIVAADRTQRALFDAAAAVREQGAADRAAAAAERAQAAHDRRLAAADRRNASLELQQAHLDELTGAYVRGLGLHALQHEIERALRTSAPFVLCFVDVDGLKAVNDREGHATGDEILRAVGGAIRSALRSYDVTARVGGDEFLCGLAGTTLAAARERFAEIESTLAALQPSASISVGFAALQPGDGVEGLMARADADLYRARRARDSAG